jgi:hypothetical protein
MPRVRPTPPTREVEEMGVRRPRRRWRQPWGDRRSVVAALAIALGLVGACSEMRRTNGEECLKNDDCLSGVCSALVCVAVPPVLDGSAPDRSAPRDGSAADVVDAVDAADGGAADAGGDAPVDASGEAAAPADAAVDG